MARLFLSYAREDRHLIEPLARLLEQAGHVVWWDRRIAGGSDFSAEIARELASADAVLVAWSSTSVRSHWVKDEAAEGRDRGRLLPLFLDQSIAPLGFRQIQAVSLRGWDGRGEPAAFDELARAIEMIAVMPDRPVPDRLPSASPLRSLPEPPTPLSHAMPLPLSTSRSNNWWLPAGIAILVLAVIALMLLRQQPSVGPAGPSADPALPALPAVRAPNPPAASGNIDGRWRLSWSSNGAQYEGVLDVGGAQAQLDIAVTSMLGQQTVRQDCAIGGSGPFRVTCSNVRIISGAAGYLPDAFTFERSGDGSFTGSTIDPATGAAVPIVLRRE